MRGIQNPITFGWIPPSHPFSPASLYPTSASPLRLNHMPTNQWLTNSMVRSLNTSPWPQLIGLERMMMSHLTTPLRKKQIYESLYQEVISMPMLQRNNPILILVFLEKLSWLFTQVVRFSSIAQSCPTLYDPISCSMPGFPVHHQLPEFTQTYVHWVSDAIQSSHPLSSPSPPALSQVVTPAS